MSTKFDEYKVIGKIKYMNRKRDNKESLNQFEKEQNRISRSEEKNFNGKLNGQIKIAD